MQTISNHTWKDLESRKNVPTLPNPNATPNLHVAMALRFCIYLEQSVTVRKQFWLFTVKSQPHLILQECAAMLAFEGHGMVKHKSISAEEHCVRD